MAKLYKNDLTGKKMNRLKVLKFSHMSKNNGSMWECLCDCGNMKVVNTTALSKGYIKSCGCLRNEKLKKLTKHGLYGSPIYMRWASMKHRCKDTSDPVYGGKGISYDSRWETFKNFYEDMSEGFSEKLELDRIDVTKGYSKENCRWVSHTENNYNKNKQSNNVSGKTGVNFIKSLGKYRAYITFDKKQIHLGTFNTFEEAVSVRKSAELKYYGYNRP